MLFEYDNYFFQEIMSTMHHCILQFTQRLHEAEIERRTLRDDVLRSNEECNTLRNDLEVLRASIIELQMDDQKLRDKVCNLLTSYKAFV